MQPYWAFFPVMGAKKDERRLDFLKTNKPAMLIFGAGWCGPCRGEITHINDIYEAYNEEIEIIGFLVEGKHNGSYPSQKDMDDFVDRDQKRLYPLEPDANWKLFDSLGPKDRTIPALALVGADKKLVTFKQGQVAHEELFILVNKILLGRSDYVYSETHHDNEGKPDPHPKPSGQTNIEVLYDGKPAKPPIEPINGNDPKFPTDFPVAVDAWLAGYSDQNVKKAAFKLAFTTYAYDDMAYTEEEFKFEKGKVTKAKFSADKPTEIDAHWDHVTPRAHCTIDIKYDYVGKVISRDSVCTPL